MSRKKVRDENKRKTANVNVGNEVFLFLKGISKKSKFIEGLLVNYFRRDGGETR